MGIVSAENSFNILLSLQQKINSTLNGIKAEWRKFGKILWKTGSASTRLLAAFQKSSVPIREMYKARGWGELHFAVFKRVPQIQNVMVFCGQFINSTNIKGRVETILISWRTISQPRPKNYTIFFSSFQLQVNPVLIVWQSVLALSGLQFQLLQPIFHIPQSKGTL